MTGGHRSGRRRAGQYLQSTPSMSNCVGCRDYVKTCLKGKTLRPVKETLDAKPADRHTFVDGVKKLEEKQEALCQAHTKTHFPKK